MTEKELNIKKLKEEYKEPTYEAMAELYSEGYKNGLEQSRFDKRMLEQENADLKQRLNVVNEMNVANYNKYCETLKENQLLKEQLKAELNRW